MSTVAKRIQELLEEKLAGTDSFIVDIKVLPKNKIQVFIDSDSGLTIDKCEEVSRYLEFYLDNEGLVPENYNLEVSSPGIGQPLKLLRQYKKNVGRHIEVTLENGDKKLGKLLTADDSQIIMEEEVESGSNKKKVVSKKTTIPLKEIKETKVTIKF